MLRLALRFAREQFGVDRVLLTCDDDNVGSIRTIERNGGVLENVVSGPYLAKPKRRYWIDVRAIEFRRSGPRNARSVLCLLVRILPLTTPASSVSSHS